MLFEKLVALNISSQIAVVVIGSLTVAELAEKVPQKKCLVGIAIPFDRRDTFEAWLRIIFEIR